jgi:hypothetical protein
MFRPIWLGILHIKDKIISGRNLSSTNVKYSHNIKIIIPKSEIILISKLAETGWVHNTSDAYF